MANVLLTMPQKLGVETESFGDSNGTWQYEKPTGH